MKTTKTTKATQPQYMPDFRHNTVLIKRGPGGKEKFFCLSDGGLEDVTGEIVGYFGDKAGAYMCRGWAVTALAFGPASNMALPYATYALPR